MWELECEESWAPKNWCFWTVVLEKTLESPLDCKEIQLVHSESDQPWDFFGRYDAIAETPILWPPHSKSWLIGKASDAGGIRGRRRRGWRDEMAACHHQLFGHEFEWTPGAGDGQGGLCAVIHGITKSWTQLSSWTELLSCYKYFILAYLKLMMYFKPVNQWISIFCILSFIWLYVLSIWSHLLSFVL